MDLQLTDAVVVIAGAGGDIGTAMTKAFTDEGARVVAVTSSGSKPSGLADEDVIRADLSTRGSAQDLVEGIEQTRGKIDVLINNVGPIELHPDGFLSVDDVDFERVLQLNLVVTARTCRAVLPGMVARRGGSIVNLASVTARRPVASLTHYSAAKAALVNLTTCLAHEFGPHGIRVNAVSPSPVASPGKPAVLDFDYATGRPNTPDEVAALVVTLSSPRLANLTGVDHLIDGGLI